MKLVLSKVSLSNINPLEKLRKSTGMSSLVCLSVPWLLLVSANSLRKKQSKWLLGSLISGETLKSKMFTRIGSVVSSKVLSLKNLSTRLILSEPSLPARLLDLKHVSSPSVQLTPTTVVSPDSMSPSIFLISSRLLWLLPLSLPYSPTKPSKAIPIWTVELLDLSTLVVPSKNA